MSTIIAIKPCPIDLSLSGLDSAVVQYHKAFGYEPSLLIVEESNNVQGVELLYNSEGESGGGIILEVVRWLPYSTWMLTSYNGRGIIYSEGSG